jgi:RND family efflux transporter MFP subunit
MAGPVGKVLSWVVVVGVTGAAVLWATGAFHGAVVRPGREAEPPGLPAPARTAQASRETVPVVEEAVGTVRSRRTVAVAAQVIARVVEIGPREGAEVGEGQTLVRLDDREFQARLAQARKALATAEAAGNRAQQAKAQAEARLALAASRHQSQQRLLEGKVTTPERAEAAETEWLLAQSGVADAEAAIAAAAAQREMAQQVVREAEVALGYTTIAAPFEGVVAERQVEPGDLASPGRVLLVVLDPKAPRLEAAVREGLIGLVPKGARLEVVLPSVGRTVQGTVAEVVPTADPRTRTFTVRVDFDSVPGVYAGMFGRLRVPTGKREVVALPAEAVVRVGQMETVVAKAGDRWERRLVTTGAALGGGRVEVLSGLSGGETVGLPEGRP